MAESFYRWASWELFIVALALGAAGWSAYETRKANRIARDTSEAQMRPYPAIESASCSMVWVEGGVDWYFEFRLINAGSSPLFDVDLDYEIYALQAAAGGPVEGNRIIQGTLNMALLPSSGDPRPLTDNRRGMSAGRVRDAVAVTGSEKAANDATIWARCIISGLDSAQEPVAPYVVWMKFPRDIEERLFWLGRGQNQRVEDNFQPPTFNLGMPEEMARQVPPAKPSRNRLRQSKTKRA